MKLIVDLMYAGGVAGMRAGVSDTAEYGDYVAGNRVIGEESKAAMREILSEVRSGAFARRWMEEAHCGVGGFDAMRARGRAHPIEEVGVKLRSQMSWLRGSA
jgi:ketol-acid reductoisomerase